MGKSLATADCVSRSRVKERPKGTGIVCQHGAASVEQACVARDDQSKPSRELCFLVTFLVVLRGAGFEI